MKRVPAHMAQMDVLDRVLDRGIVIDACVSISLVGVWTDLVRVDAHIVVASIQTYLKHADAAELGTGTPRPTRSAESLAKVAECGQMMHEAPPGA